MMGLNPQAVWAGSMCAMAIGGDVSVRAAPGPPGGGGAAEGSSGATHATEHAGVGRHRIEQDHVAQCRPARPSARHTDDGPAPLSWTGTDLDFTRSPGVVSSRS